MYCPIALEPSIPSLNKSVAANNFLLCSQTLAQKLSDSVRGDTVVFSGLADLDREQSFFHGQESATQEWSKKFKLRLKRFKIF